MSLPRLCGRIAKLEARRPSPEEPYCPPEPPEGWYEEVWRLLWQYGHLEIVLRETFELPDEEVAHQLEEAARYFAGTDWSR